MYHFVPVSLGKVLRHSEPVLSSVNEGKNGTYLIRLVWRLSQVVSWCLSFQKWLESNIRVRGHDVKCRWLSIQQPLCLPFLGNRALMFSVNHSISLVLRKKYGSFPSSCLTRRWVPEPCLVYASILAAPSCFPETGLGDVTWYGHGQLKSGEICAVPKMFLSHA